MSYNLVGAFLVVGLAATVSRLQSQEAVPDPRPTIAVMHFSGTAMSPGTDYSGLGPGMRELIATALASNTSLRVVERGRMQALLDQQQIGASSAIDPATAARLGRVLGANHFLIGSYVIDPKDKARLDIRSVNVETSEIEYQQ